ncbi:MAG: hypothetical protein PVI03_03575 [Candidatus Thorarchaeota archaeon]|jgi:hypothetical protein
MLKALSELKLRGNFHVECFDKDGNLKWVEEGHNLVVNEGLNHILDVQFHAETQVTTWYVGLKGTGSEAAGDTLASHAGWSEITAYTGDRKEFVEGAASSQQISNTGNAASFSITGTATVAGAFICSVSTGSAGKLFCVADFSSPRSVDNGDTLNVTYTITAADDGV